MEALKEQLLKEVKVLLISNLVAGRQIQFFGKVSIWPKRLTTANFTSSSTGAGVSSNGKHGVYSCP